MPSPTFANSSVEPVVDRAARNKFVQRTRKYSFVTVVYEVECDLLALQARSMQRYCPEKMIDSIVVIDNSLHPLPRDKKLRLIAEYGRFAKFVRILRAEEIARIPETNSYTAQQILKLMVATHVQTERYVVLDAKNHFVFSLTPEFLEAPDGRARIHVHSYKNHLMRGCLVNVLSYLGIYSDDCLNTFTICGTPFVMYTDIVRKLIHDISENEHARFETVFVRNKLTEFFLYTGYIMQSGISVKSLYDFHQLFPPSVWPNTADEKGCTLAITRSNESQTPLFGVHRMAIAALGQRQRNLIAGFWFNRGLFETKDAANLFLLTFRRRYMQSQIKLIIQRRISNLFRTFRSMALALWHPRRAGGAIRKIVMRATRSMCSADD
jgi:Family of unknown function (DUF6492)